MVMMKPVYGLRSIGFKRWVHLFWPWLLAARTGEPSSLETSRLYQALGITLHGENAHAVPRRRATIPDTRALLDEA